MTNSINKIASAGFLLAVATCCGAPEASSQLYLNIGGSGTDNTSAQTRSITTNNLGLGGAGSATAFQGLNEPVIGSNRGMSFPLFNQQAGKSLGATGNPAGAAEGSLSSALDRPYSPGDSVTNTLMGPANSLVPPNTAASPAAKRKQSANATAASSGSGGAATQSGSSKSP